VSTAPAPEPNHIKRLLQRGLAVILPPILTTVILVWIWQTLSQYLIEPINFGVHRLAISAVADVRRSDALKAPPPGFPALPQRLRSPRLTPEFARRLAEGSPRPETLTEEKILAEHGDEVFIPVSAPLRSESNGLDPTPCVPLRVYEPLSAVLPPAQMPDTPDGVYIAWLDRVVFGPGALNAMGVAAVVVLVYFTGQFFTWPAGRAIWSLIDRALSGIPVVRAVYTSVRQVTDLVFSKPDVQFRRVVAVQYPKAGTWCVGFVVGEGMLDIEKHIGEPTVTVLVPTSPAPVTGFTNIYPRSEVVDLNLSIDEALRFIISCGVVLPPHQHTPARVAAPDLPPPNPA